MAAQDSLKVATILGRTASGSSTGVPDWDQEEMRLAVTALLTPGYLPAMTDQSLNVNAFNVRQDTGSNMQLKIGSGTTKKDGYVVLGGSGQGAYIVRLDATTKTITVPAADATNPARYGVYLYIDDTAYSGTASRAYANVSCIRGTPAGSPTTPAALSTYSAYALLWEFQLAANATAVTNTILDNTSISTDRRRPAHPATTPVRVRWKRNASQSISASTITSITWDTSVYDLGPWGTAGASITVPTNADGTYLISTQVNWFSLPSGAYVAIYVNGAVVTTNAPTISQFGVTSVVPLVAGDVVTIRVFETGTVAVTTAFVDLVRLGP